MTAGRRTVLSVAVLCALCALCAGLLALSGIAASSTGGGGMKGRGETGKAWGTCSPGIIMPDLTWYLAEGCTDGGFETWVLVQNPGDSPVEIEMELQTDEGPVPGPADTVPARGRRTYDLSRYVVSYHVSTRLTATDPVVCERAMYGNSREWGSCSAGSAAMYDTCYLAEGCTDGGFETWVLVQNPGDSPVEIEMELQTDEGPVPGPADTVPARGRRTYDLSRYVVSYHVSTRLTATDPVVCERAMYGNSREWGSCSAGSAAMYDTCYLAEGCTLPGFETWVLVQNPGDAPVEIKMELLTETGEVPGPADTVPARGRRTYDLSRYAPGASLSAIVRSKSPVVVERSMYGGARLWGTCSAPSREPSAEWHLAEGCTAPGFETWLAVVNPSFTETVEVAVTLQTGEGAMPGPRGRIQPRRRATFDLGEYVNSYEVSARLEASGKVTCERSMYGDGTNRRPVAPVDGPPLYPFTRDASIACGHWPAGSTDYPYFGAPRSGTRLHAGVDIYPPAGAGAPVRSMKTGTVVKTGLFYTRYTGEQTFAVLVDHGDFVVNYTELRPPEPWLRPGVAVGRGQVIGAVSGTVQLHLEMYAPGTTGWLSWYGPQPANLLDPTALMLTLY